MIHRNSWLREMQIMDRNESSQAEAAKDAGETRLLLVRGREPCSLYHTPSQMGRLYPVRTRALSPPDG